MFLTWLLCRHDGREFRLLQDREPGAFIEGELNGGRSAEITVPQREVADARSSASRIHPGRSRLKVYAHPFVDDPARTLIFNGTITAPRVMGDRITIPAVDQTWRLRTASPSPLAAVGQGQLRVWDDVEASKAMWQLIEWSDERAIALQADHPDIPTLGIRRGNLADSKIKRKAQIADGPSTWDLLVQESERLRTPDFEFVPFEEPSNGSDIHATFNTHHPRMGSDRTDEVILEDGYNAHMEHEPLADLCNRFVAVGQARAAANNRSPVYVAENRASMEMFGVHQVSEAFSVNDYDRLQRKAEAELARRSRVQHHFAVRPMLEAGGQATGWARDGLGAPVAEASDSFGIPPVFLPGENGQYWLGDTITLRSRRFFIGVIPKGRLRSDYEARVQAFRFEELDVHGNVGTELQVLVEDRASAIRGYFSEVFSTTR